MISIAVLFPGQGTQGVRMGKALCDRFDEARKIFALAGETLGFDISRLCFEGETSELTRTSNAQPAILTASYAAYRVWSEVYELEPCFMAGHSLGEYTALVCAGALSFPEALKLVRTRGRLMEEANRSGAGTMAAIKGVPAARVSEKCQQWRGNGVVVAANYNTPGQTVISGHLEAVREVARQLQGEGAEVVFLDVSAAFHSPLMAPAAEALAGTLEAADFRAPAVPVISNVTARPYEGVEALRAGLKAQMTAPVCWAQTMAFLASHAVDIVIDTGPRAVLRDLSKENSLLMAPFSLDVEADRNRLQERLFSVYFRFLKKALGAAISEKNRNDDLEAYEAGVVVPYGEIRTIYREIVEQGRIARPADARRAMEMLRRVFLTKQVPEEVVRARIDGLVKETGLESFFSGAAR